MSEEHFLLIKRGLYYRPNNQGYTGIKENAGRYREVDALGLDGVVAIHEDDAPEYSSACFADLAQAHMAKKLHASADRIEKLEACLNWYADQMCEGLCQGKDPKACANIGADNCAGCPAVVALSP